jgi:HAD superfamily hydrolase (TIGR01509 family)
LTTSTTRPPLAAVLFDMDGTLVETEHYWGEGLQALARRLGGELSDQGRQATVGTSMRTSMGILDADLGIERTEAEWAADGRWVEDTTAELMTAGVAWRPGAAGLLLAVREAGRATALVTTTPRRLAAIVLRTISADLGVDPFDVTVCGDEVPALKPDPAPYLQAMAGLRVPARNCVVVEDSQAGVTAGLAAGAVVVGVPSLQPLSRAPGLVVLDSLVGLGAGDLEALLTSRDVGDSAA